MAPIRIVKRRTEFGWVWRVRNQGVVVAMFHNGAEALAFVDKELRAIHAQQVEQERQQRLAAMLMERLQQRQQPEIQQ